MLSKTPPSMRQLLMGLAWIASRYLLSVQPGLITRPSLISCARVRPLVLGWWIIRSHKAEEEKQCWEMGEHPRKWGQADTVGSTLAELSTLGVKKVLRVCTYCAKQGELFLLLFILFFELPL